MEDFQDQDILNIPDGFEYKFREVDLQGQFDQEEPMDYDSDILEEEESAQPAASEDQSLFGFGGGTIFEQDVPVPTPQPSLCRMS